MRYHTTIDVTKLPSSSNTISLDDIDVQAVSGVFGHTTNGGSNVALRLPTVDDPQFPNGHALGEFFTVVKAAQKTVYASLTASFDIIGAVWLLKNQMVRILSPLSSRVYIGGSGSLYQLSGDIVATAQTIFDSGCELRFQKILSVPKRC